MRNLTRLLAFVTVIALVTAIAAVAQPLGPGDLKVRVKNVNCDRNQSISSPLRHLPTPLEIVFTGTCNEHVVIDRHDVTVRGGAESATLVGSVVFTGSLRSAVRDFTIVVADAENGIEVTGSSVEIRNIDIREFTHRGIEVHRGGDATISDVSITTTQPGAVVALLARGGEIFMDSGTVELAGAAAGMSGTMGARYRVSDVDIHIHDNATGVFFQVNAAMIFQSGKLRVVDNFFAGFTITSGANIHYGTVEIQASNNGQFGMIIQSNATLVPFPGTSLTFDASNNGTGGIALQNDAVFIMSNGPQTVTGNGGFAILADNQSNLGVSDGTTIGGPPGTSVFVFDSSFALFGANTTLQIPLICDDTVNVDGRDCDVVLEDSRVDGEIDKALDALLATLYETVK